MFFSALQILRRGPTSVDLLVLSEIYLNPFYFATLDIVGWAPAWQDRSVPEVGQKAMGDGGGRRGAPKLMDTCTLHLVLFNQFSFAHSRQLINGPTVKTQQQGNLRNSRTNSCAMLGIK